MPKFTMTHEIHCDLEHFWKLFLDKEFNERLYKDILEFPEFEILEMRETEHTIHRKTRGMPKLNAPPAVQKLLGSNFRYLEEGTFDKSKKTYHWKMTPSVLAGKLIQDGGVRAESVGEHKTKRMVDLIVEAKVFGVGGLIESATEKQVRDGWNKSAHFMNEWIKKHHDPSHHA